MNTFLQAPNGDLSSGRLLMMITNLVILGVWVFAAIIKIKNGQDMPPIPGEVLGLGASTVVGKVVNSMLSEKDLGNGSR